MADGTKASPSKLAAQQRSAERREKKVQRKKAEGKLNEKRQEMDKAKVSPPCIYPLRTKCRATQTDYGRSEAVHFPPRPNRPVQALRRYQGVPLAMPTPMASDPPYIDIARARPGVCGDDGRAAEDQKARAQAKGRVRFAHPLYFSPCSRHTCVWQRDERAATQVRKGRRRRAAPRWPTC